jgi:lysyl-tRNA synthetase, class II
MSTTEPLEQLIELRKEKLKKLKEAGINPYPSGFLGTTPVAGVLAKYASLAHGQEGEETVSVSGRMISRREMGKASFVDICENTGKIQAYFKADLVGGDSYKIFKDLVDIADFVGIQGKPFRTRMGELTIKVESWTFLSKSLRPLPEKWHGLKDVETRYRQRYLDLISNQEIKKIFENRSTIILTLRKELESRGFLEVETPMMQVIPGGAMAKPFLTHHNALNMDLYLRIAPELYLKRLVAGGMEKVFEIGKNFRNEGIDKDHNPEFTMLELYQAYVGYEQMMTLVEELLSACATSIGKTLATPFKRVKMFDALKEATGVDIKSMLGTPRLFEEAKKLKIDIPDGSNDKKILDHIFDELVVPKFTEPTFVIEYPSAYSPLAKPKPDDKDIAERFELFIGGMEVANAYSELNDPVEQRKRFAEQMEDRKKGDEEAQPFDEDFIVAIEHGLPPTGGLGIGLDRIVMVLAGIESIREVILFPTMRPEL